MLYIDHNYGFCMDLEEYHRNCDQICKEILSPIKLPNEYKDLEAIVQKCNKKIMDAMGLEVYFDRSYKPEVNMMNKDKWFEKHFSKREKYTGPSLTVSYQGFSGNTAIMEENGWIIELHRGKRGGKDYLYVHNPETRICGRCEYHDNLGAFELEFLTHNKNRRFRNGPPIQMTAQDYNHISTEDLYAIILERQAAEKPVKKVPLRLNSAEILHLEDYVVHVHDKVKTA